MTRRAAAVLPLAFALLCAHPVAAQYEDEQTDDHAERDRRYLERYRKPADTPAEDRAIDPREQERYFAFVDDLIRDRNYRAKASEHYRIQSDDPRIDPAGVATLLESFHGFFDEHWGTRLDLEPYDEISRVYMFWSYHKYNKLLGADFSRSMLRPQGHYGSAFDAVTLHTDSGDPGDVPDTLIHEAAHQLIDQRIDWTRGSAPTWLGEGLASYFGYMQVDADGTFHADRVGTKRVVIFRDGKATKPYAPTGRLATFKQGVKDAKGDSIYGRILWMTEPAQFYGTDTLFHYAAAWMLVHWLFEADDGAHAEVFFEWIASEAAGKAEPQHLLDALGLTPAELDTAVVGHARRVKVR